MKPFSQLLKSVLLLKAVVLVMGLPTGDAMAQAMRSGTGQKTSFSLKQAVEYAVANNASTKSTAIDMEIADARVGEIRSIGLPQINGQADFSHAPDLQKFVLENSPGTPFYSPMMRDGEVIAFALSLPNSGSAALSVNQLIFDGSYIIGLKAASTYREFAKKQHNQSKVELAEQVTKAYYAVLVNRQRIGLLDANITRLDSTIREMRAMLAQGFVEKIDVQRIEVSRNNLISEKQKADRLVALTSQLLKFQMGFPQNDELVLTDKLEDVKLESEGLAPEIGFDYNRRIEYSVLQTQKTLAQLDLKNTQAGYLPRLGAFYTLGANTASSQISNLMEFDKRWFSNAMVGVRLTVPIFDGLGKYYKATQNRLTLKKIEAGEEQVRQSIDLQIRQANTMVSNANESLKVQKDNMELATEVLRVAKLKYKQGVGSNLEVTTAETALKEAQNNYYNALYEAIIAKVDMEKATGKLFPVN